MIDEAAAQLKIESNIKPQTIIDEEKNIETIEIKLKNISPENIEEREKLLERKELSINKLNEITNDWNNDREKIEQLTFLLKEENRLILKIEELSIHSDEIDNFENLNNLEAELHEVESEIKNVEIIFQKLQRNRKYNLKYKVEPDDIADVISKITGIPITLSLIHI